MCAEERARRIGEFRSRVHFVGNKTPDWPTSGEFYPLRPVTTRRLTGFENIVWVVLVLFLVMLRDLQYVPARLALLHHPRLHSQQPTIARSPLLAQPQRVLGILLRPSGRACSISHAAGSVFGHVTDALGSVAQCACCTLDCVAEDVTETADCEEALLERGMFEAI